MSTKQKYKTANCQRSSLSRPWRCWRWCTIALELLMPWSTSTPASLSCKAIHIYIFYHSLLEFQDRTVSRFFVLLWHIWVTTISPFVELYLSSRKRSFNISPGMIFACQRLRQWSCIWFELKLEWTFSGPSQCESLGPPDFLLPLRRNVFDTAIAWQLLEEADCHCFGIGKAAL